LFFTITIIVMILPVDPITRKIPTSTVMTALDSSLVGLKS